MRKITALLLIVVFALFNIQVVEAQTSATNIQPGNARPVIGAQSAILIDATTGETLFEQNANQRLAMASTTKIMTAIVALEKGNLDSVVTVTPTVLDRHLVYGTMIYLEPGEKITLRDLLYALLLNSANDAAVAIAEHIGGNVDNFVKMMNDKAKELGATDTNFINPNGLTAQGHYSSARDMALFAKYGLQNPTFAQIVRTKQAEIPRYKPELPTKLDNINRMLGMYEGVDGVKTGYTAEAGNCVVESASRNGRQLIVVILKSTAPKEMYKDAEKLFDYGFAGYENKQLATKGQIMDSVTLADGKVLKLAAAKDVFVTVPVGNQENFTLQARADNLSLPIDKGETRGELQVYRQGKLVQTVPLVASDTIISSFSIPPKTKLNFEWVVLVIISLIIVIIVMPVVLRWRRRSIVRARGYGYYRD